MSSGSLQRQIILRFTVSFRLLNYMLFLKKKKNCDLLDSFSIVITVLQRLQGVTIHKYIHTYNT